MYSTGNHIVDSIGKLNFEGNVIPHTWYQTLKKENGKPDLNAMILLADFIYWYRPTIERDEQTGMIKSVRKKFKSDLLQRSYKQIEEQFGLSMKQAKEALVRLEEKNVLRRVFRTVDTPQGKLPNIMFIELNINGLVQITFPKDSEVCTKKDGYLSENVQTITEITTENTTNINNNNNAAAQIIKFWDINGFGSNNINSKEKLLAFLDDGLSVEMILKALELAVDADAKKYNYVHKILIDWINKGFKTIQDVIENEEKFKKSKQQRNTYYNQPKKKSLFDPSPETLERQKREAERYKNVKIEDDPDLPF